ncbi:MAG TPA: spore coat associated protein CotJA [Candidatus Pullilachnospira intestinigallinarum]|nr:spore coat associated protein CotJA [Candidatus Pullilachnospira intestinigallinarum]
MNSACRRGAPAARQNRASCGCSQTAREDFYQHLSHLPLAMGYVPTQHFQDTFELCRGLQMGTIFPELCKPFCGKGGRCR